MTGLAADSEALVWILGGTALAVVLAAVQYRLLRRRLARPRAALLALLRASAVSLVVAALAGPRLASSAARRVPRPLAVAVDATRSMGLSGGLARTRLDRVRDLLAGPEFAAALAGWVPEYYVLGETAVRLPAEGLASLRADRPGTGPAAAIGRLRELAGEGAGAILLFTDGGSQAEPDASPRGEPSVPLLVVGVGAGERPQDIEIASVASPGLAFAGQPATFRARIRARGLGARTVPVLLKRGQQVLASSAVDLPAGGGEAEAELVWVPPDQGAHKLAVEVPVQEGEQLAENNRADLVLEVRRDKIRVLLVSGSPSWSYRFLRGALKGDATIDLVSFIILRSASDAVDVPQSELSLIPFPTQRIFLEELPNFDLLVFDDFAYQPYLPASYLEKVRDFVRGGGAFWMLGGPRSFGGGRYEASPLVDVLPVLLPASPQPDGGYRDVPLVARLTPAGRNHPLFQGVADANAPLPPLAGINLVAGPRPGAVPLALATLPDGTVAPVVVAGRHGEGRVLAILTDTLWRWAFEEVGRGRGSRAYLALVRQALRWSVGDPGLEPLQVEPERPRVAPGGSISARVRVLGDDYLPAATAAVSVTLRGPDGVSRALVPVVEAPGVLRVAGDATVPGVWEISAATEAGRRAEATVTVGWPEEELSAAGPDDAALAALGGGGRTGVLKLGDPGETAAAVARALEELAPPVEERSATTRTPAEEPWFFLAFLGVVGTEWLLRRRSGLD